MAWGSCLTMARALPSPCRHAEAKNVDHLAVLGGGDSEHNEMSPLATVPRDMECPDVVTDFRPFLDPNDGWAGA